MKHIEDALRELGKVENESDGFTDEGKASLKKLWVARAKWKKSRESLDRAPEETGDGWMEDMASTRLRGIRDLAASVDYLLKFLEEIHSVPFHALQSDYAAMGRRVEALTKMSMQEGVPFPLTHQVPKSWDEIQSDNLSHATQEESLKKVQEADNVIRVTNPQWEDDHTQFPRLLAELWAAHEMSMDSEAAWTDGTPIEEKVFSVRVNQLEQSMDLPWERVKELFERAEKAFEKDKRTTLSLAPTIREQEVLGYLENELLARSKEWTFGDMGVSNWEVCSNCLRMFLDGDVYIKITVEEVPDGTA